jgi:hypothetical protein
MKGLIKRLLREGLLEDVSLSIGKPVKDVELSDADKKSIKNLSWKDIDFEQLNEDSPVILRVILPVQLDLSNAISLEIQLTRNGLYQPHLFIADSLRGLGLGYKLHIALIHAFGHLYSANARRLNDVEIPKIWSKLKNEPNISCVSNDMGELCVSNYLKGNDELINQFKNI